MTRRYIFTVDNTRRYALVSTTSVGRAGPPGQDGSGSPGLEFSDIALDEDGNPYYTWTSEFGIDFDGNPYYLANADLIPADEMAWFDATSVSLVRGVPGRADVGASSGFRRRVWSPLTGFAENDWFTYAGATYIVIAPFISGVDFDTNHLETWSERGIDGSDGPPGPGVTISNSPPTSSVGLPGGVHIRRVFSGSTLLDVVLYGPKGLTDWPDTAPVSLRGPQGLPGLKGDQGEPGEPGTGEGGGAALGTATPQPLGHAAPGTSTLAAHQDHTHELVTGITLREWTSSGAFQLLARTYGSATRPALVTSATVIWPDGTAGHYRAKGTSSSGEVTSYEVTYERVGHPILVVSQGATTIDGLGRLSVSPVLTVAEASDMSISDSLFDLASTGLFEIDDLSLFEIESAG